MRYTTALKFALNYLTSELIQLQRILLKKKKKWKLKITVPSESYVPPYRVAIFVSNWILMPYIMYIHSNPRVLYEFLMNEPSVLIEDRSEPRKRSFSLIRMETCKNNSCTFFSTEWYFLFFPSVTVCNGSIKRTDPLDLLTDSGNYSKRELSD